MVSSGMKRLPERILCLVTDRRLAGGDDALAGAVAASVAAGVNMVQVREKDLPTHELAALAVRLRGVTQGKALLTVNGDLRAATEAGADGVQLSEDAAPVAEARRTLGRGRIIGRSVHSLTGAVEAEQDGADFLVLGTVFPSASHPGGPTGGVRLVREVTQAVGIPVIGIGGITEATAGRVIEAGAAGVAVISAILGAAEPGVAAARLAEAIGLERVAAPTRSDGEAGSGSGSRK